MVYSRFTRPWVIKSAIYGPIYLIFGLIPPFIAGKGGISWKKGDICLKEGAMWQLERRYIA